mgnify:CR=1 FL=1
MGKRLWVERNKDGSWDAFSRMARTSNSARAVAVHAGRSDEGRAGRLRRVVQPVRRRAYVGRWQGREDRGGRHV